MNRSSNSGRSNRGRSSASNNSGRYQRSESQSRNNSHIRNSSPYQGRGYEEESPRSFTRGNRPFYNDAPQRGFQERGNRREPGRPGRSIYQDNRPNPNWNQPDERRVSHRSGGAAMLRDTVAPTRVSVVVILCALLMAILVFSLFGTQVLQAQDILDRGSARVQTVPIKAQRGTIYDRNGVVLATTVDAVNIFCHPSKITADESNKLAEALAEKCGGKVEEYKEKMATSNKEDFAYLHKLCDKEAAAAIKEMKFTGVDFEDTVKRVYPCGEVGSQLIGILNAEGVAVSGLELYYNDILAGQNGKKEIEYSADGFPVPGGTKVLEEKIDGRDIMLSIDVELQRQVELALALRVEEVQGDGGTALVMDSKSGEIYAASSAPTFNITDLSTIKDNAATTIRGITQAFEPGSVFKALTMTAALEEGTTQAGQKYWCPEQIEVDQYVITDSHDRPAMEMDTSTIMAESSNIGLSLIAQDLTWEKLYEYIQKYQITDLTGVDYPGENSGYISKWENWSDTQGMNISFGQGLTTTPMEIVRFYGALADNGYMHTPHFLINIPADGGVREYESKEIIENKQAISDVTEMLEAVVEEGTGTDAQIRGFRVAGKTGTAEVASETGGYKEGVYNISFVGFIPNSSSNFVCFVGANDVPGERKTVSAFRDIMRFAIDRYNITQN